MHPDKVRIIDPKAVASASPVRIATPTIPFR
jgi:hypothetical protein